MKHHPFSGNPCVIWRGYTIVVTDTEFDTEWVNVLDAYRICDHEPLTDQELEDFNQEKTDEINEAFAEKYVQEFYIALK